MPNNVPAGSSLQVTVYCQVGAQTSVNVLHYKPNTIQAGTIDLDAWLTAFDTAVRTEWLALMPAEATLWGYKCSVFPANANFRPSFLKGLGDANWVGTRGDGYLPMQCASLSTILTNTSGRSAQGRMYFPFLALAGYTGETGQMNAAWRLDHGTLNQTLLIRNVAGPSGIIGFQIAVAHRTSGTLTPGYAIQSNGLIATQRRRGDYGKANRPPF